MGYFKNITTPDNVVFEFKINPAKPGQNTFSLNTYYTNGTSVENIKNVYLEFLNEKKDLGPLVDTMNKTSNGNYSLTGSYISQDGNWQIKMTIQRIGQYDINENFNVVIKN
jgi:hypothetical protein